MVRASSIRPYRKISRLRDGAPSIWCASRAADGRLESGRMPRLNETLGANEVAITFVNHATFRIQTGAMIFLTDPVWSERASPFRQIGPKRVRKPGVAFENLPRSILSCSATNHYDHLDVATLKQLRQPSRRRSSLPPATRGLSTPLDSRMCVSSIGEIQFNDTLKVTFVPAQHFSARGPFDKQKSLWGRLQD
jgi:L-ascorbate metabolism protein UlaG (beta-lactamase superfamily)